MGQRIRWVVVSALVLACDPRSGDEPAREATPDNKDAVVAEALDEALSARGPTKAVVGDARVSSIEPSYQLRWRVNRFGTQDAGDTKESCFVDAAAQKGTIRRLVVHCDGTIVFDSEDTLGYGAEVKGARLVEFPEAPPKPSVPSRYGYGYGSQPEPQPQTLRYHLTVDRVAEDRTSLALSTAEGWLSLRQEGLLDQKERRWTFGGEQLQRSGDPILLPRSFVPQQTEMFVRATQSLEPSALPGPGCSVRASVMSIDSGGEARCRVSMSCGEDRTKTEPLLEDVEGSCTLTESGRVASAALAHEDDSERLRADFEDHTAVFTEAEGSTKIALEQGGLIGVPACDEYMEKYLRCIDEHLPEVARQQTRKAVQQSIEAWKQAAQGPAVDTLAETCRNALSTARRATAAMGCEW